VEVKIKIDTKNIAWKCKFCGSCCDCPSVSKKDIANISGHLNLKFEEFTKKYLSNFDKFTGKIKKSKEKCVFLDENKRCKIYKVRPIICRLRPYSIQIKNSELCLTYDPWFLEHCNGLYIGNAPPEEEYIKHAETVYKYLGEEKNTPEESYEKAKKRLKKTKKD
jgi:Fe-S-cluster containining protein